MAFYDTDVSLYVDFYIVAPGLSLFAHSQSSEFIRNALAGFELFIKGLPASCDIKFHYLHHFIDGNLNWKPESALQIGNIVFAN